jgi:hypothetical protein
MGLKPQRRQGDATLARNSAAVACECGAATNLECIAANLT